MIEESILTDAHDIVTGRDKGYGDPVDSAERIATAFTAITGRELFPKDIALIQILSKMVRSEHNYKRDNMLDAAGYTWIRERCLVKAHKNPFEYTKEDIDAIAPVLVDPGDFSQRKGLRTRPLIKKE